jgi:AcrR family transcriptional regulator
MGQSPRAPRADSVRNRERLLVAARELFARVGPDASMEEVAQLAGVAKGTVFRHFETKHELLEAVLVDRYEQLTQTARRAHDDDPTTAFEETFWQVATDQAADQAFAASLGDWVDRLPRATQARRQLLDVMAGSLRQAQTDGRIRRDISPDDIPWCMCAIGQVAVNGGAPGGDRDPWTTVAELLLRGMRTA